MLRDVTKMTEKELRQELTKIRGERAGKGRQKRKEAKTKRIVQAGTDRKRRTNVEAEENADWV